MKLRRIDPSVIQVPEVRVTAQFDEDLFSQFQESIKRTGQVAPIICCEVEGQFVLVDGLHRLQEALNAGDRAIDVVVIPGDMTDVLSKNIFLDHLRGKTPVSQMVKVIKTLYTEFNLDPDRIKEKTGLTRDYIERLLKIGEASQAVQQALDQGVIGVGHAYELSRLPFPIQQEEIIAKHQVWRFTVKEVKEQIDAVLKEMDLIAKEPPPTPSSGPLQPRVYNCEGCKQETDPRYLRPVMLCPDCFGAVWKLAKAAEKAKVESDENGGGD